MSKPFLNAHFGICVGGMFFKVGDCIHVKGMDSRGRMMEAKGPIQGITVPFHNVHDLSVLDTGKGFLFIFDYTKIETIEHVASYEMGSQMLLDPNEEKSNESFSD